MARKITEEAPDNHERWLVSYADFITLLFAFFVVMYALSTVNEGKYRILSDSLIHAFRNVDITTSTQVAIITGIADPHYSQSTAQYRQGQGSAKTETARKNAQCRP